MSIILENTLQIWLEQVSIYQTLPITICYYTKDGNYGCGLWMWTRDGDEFPWGLGMQAKEAG